MGEDFATFKGGEGRERTSVEPRIFEAQAPVHTIGSQLKRLLPYIVLQGMLASVAKQAMIGLTCMSVAGEMERSFIKDLTTRRRLTRVAINRGSTP